MRTFIRTCMLCSAIVFLPSQMTGICNAAAGQEPETVTITKTDCTGKKLGKSISADLIGEAGCLGAQAECQAGWGTSRI